MARPAPGAGSSRRSVNDARADFVALSRALVRERGGLSGATAPACADVPRETFGLSARRLADYYEAERLGARREVVESVLGLRISTAAGLPDDTMLIVAPGPRPLDVNNPDPERVLLIRGARGGS